MVEHYLIAAALLLLTSVIASKFAARFGVPALLLFVLMGMLLGSEGIGGIWFDYAALTQAVGVVALVCILFSGGLATQWEDIRPVLSGGVLLATVGVMVTALAVGAFMHVFFNFSWSAGILLGAIVASTDAAAVFAVLRGKGIQLKGKLKPLLEFESGSNDPMAVFLTFGMIHLLLNPATSPLELIPMFIAQMCIGGALGYTIGRLTLAAINQSRLEYEGLYPVLSIGLMLLTYGLTATLGGNGFLAVYVAALVLARSPFIHKNSLCSFHDGLAWLMQIIMFLTLGLQVYPSRLLAIAGLGILVTLFLIFIARPLAVILATLGMGLNWRERAFVAWVGLRGAAPIILATFPLLAGIETPVPIFELVFFVVLTSVLLQGTLLVPVARWLWVLDTAPPFTGSILAQMVQNNSLMSYLVEVNLPPTSPVVGQRVLDLALPPATLMVLIRRKEAIVVPSGSTILEAHDCVVLLASQEHRGQIRTLLNPN